MGNILRHTGINIGAISSVSWIFREDVIGFTYNDSSLLCSVTPRIGAGWNSVYGTPETIQLDSEQQDTPAGLKNIYKLKMLVPKDRREVETELLGMNGRLLMVRVTDKNGVIRILGSPENPMKLTCKLLKPPAMEGFNGYELLFSGEMSKPAGFMVVGTGGIPDDNQL